MSIVSSYGLQPKTSLRVKEKERIRFVARSWIQLVTSLITGLVFSSLGGPRWCENSELFAWDKSWFFYLIHGVQRQWTVQLYRPSKVRLQARNAANLSLSSSAPLRRKCVVRSDIRLCLVQWLPYLLVLVLIRCIWRGLPSFKTYHHKQINRHTRRQSPLIGCPRVFISRSILHQRTRRVQQKYILHRMRRLLESENGSSCKRHGDRSITSALSLLLRMSLSWCWASTVYPALYLGVLRANFMVPSDTPR